MFLFTWVICCGRLKGRSTVGSVGRESSKPSRLVPWKIMSESWNAFVCSDEAAEEDEEELGIGLRERLCWTVRINSV
jgi:hypothetical protein